MNEMNKEICKKDQRREKARKFIKTMFSRKMVIVAATGVVIFILLAIFAGIITPYNPNTTSPYEMLMYGKEASNRKQEIDRQHYTIPNQRPKDKHCGKI